MQTPKKIDEEMLNSLYDMFLELKSREDCKNLFDDLFTLKEVEQLAQRVKSAQLLLDGKTYNQVMEITDISSATLSRVSRCVQYGSGYSVFLKKSK